MCISISIGELDAFNGDARWAHVALSFYFKFAPAHLQNFGVITLQTICDTVVTSFRGHFLATRSVNNFSSRIQICIDRSPHRTAPRRTALHRTASHRTAPHCIALYMFLKIQTVPHLTFENVTVQCAQMSLASTTSFV